MNQLTPTGQAWQNLVKYRTQETPGVSGSGGDPNFLSNLDSYKGGKEAWWNRHGKNSVGTDVLSGAAFLQKPGEFNFDVQRPGEFNFDTQGALEQINQRAESLYSPQRAQIEALRQLGQAQYEEQRITTAEEFEDLLRREEEAYNKRGAYFSSGALNKTSKILEQKGRSLGQLDIQNAANQAQLLAQQGLLSAKQAEYVQQQLTSAESGLYQRYRDKVADWRDERNFAYSKYRDTKQDYYKEKDWLVDTYRDERDYNMQYYMWKKDYKLRKKNSN